MYHSIDARQRPRFPAVAPASQEKAMIVPSPSRTLRCLMTVFSNVAARSDARARFTD
jgi:hypothetical protein